MKTLSIFRALRTKVTILVICRRFKVNFGAIIASGEGTSEKIKVICWGRTYDVIIFKFQGGAFAPPAPPDDANALQYS